MGSPQRLSRLDAACVPPASPTSDTSCRSSASLAHDLSPSTPPDSSTCSRGRGMARRTSVLRGSEPARNPSLDHGSPSSAANPADQWRSEQCYEYCVPQAAPIKAVCISPTHASASATGDGSAQPSIASAAFPVPSAWVAQWGHDPLSRPPSPPAEPGDGQEQEHDLEDPDLPFDMDMGFAMDLDTEDRAALPAPPAVPAHRPRARTYLPPQSTPKAPSSVLRKYSVPTLRPVYGKVRSPPSSGVRVLHTPIPPSHRDGDTSPVLHSRGRSRGTSSRHDTSPHGTDASTSQEARRGIPIPGPIAIPMPRRIVPR